MTTGFTPLSKAFFIVILIAISNFSASSQEANLKSRVAVVNDNNKTNIWVSDFPKQTNIVIMDSENNLLSVMSTNNYGAAFLSLPVALKTNVIVKTVNGEIIVSNKAIDKNAREESKGALVSQEDVAKA